MTYKSTMKIYINDLNLDDIKGDEEEEIEWDLVKCEPKTTWYIFEEKEAPTWRLWGEEKTEDAIYTVYLKKVRYHHPSRSITQESDDDEISHLEWETVRVRFLKAGTLEKLIESLASDSGELESTFVNVFLATYRTFASTKQVLNLILDRYLALNSSSNKIKIPPHLREDHKKALRLTLQVWLDAYPEDFRDPPKFTCLQQLREFTRANLPDSDLNIKVGYKLEKMRKEEETKGSPMLERILSCEEMRIHCSSPMKNGHHQPYEFLDISEETFAQQLTRMDTVLFKGVVAHQCLGSVWSRRDRGRGDSAATVTATVDQFNAVSFRVQSTILVDTELKPSQRARLIVKWIDIAQELRMLKNFSSLKAIISGLQSNPIYRLKKTWGAVIKDKAELFEELARIFSEENNQLNQRELLMKEGTAKHAETAHANDRHLPKALEKLAINPLAVSYGTIPYLGTFLTDLTMIDTAIPDTVSNGLINFDKKRKEFEVLAQIRLLQGAANAYQMVRDEMFERWWDSVLVLDDKEAWRLSCQIEPQGSSAPSSTRESRMRKRAQFSHRKNDSIASTSSGSSSSQFFFDNDSINSPTSHNDTCSLERKMSTSSSSSSLPSLDVSVHSGGTSTSGRTPDRTSSNSQQQQSTQSPYITPDFYIIRVSIESSAHEIEGVNLYKSIMLSNSERTVSVIRKAMEKHGFEGNPEDYTLAQFLPDGEMLLPASANVYYAINTQYDLNFVLRRRRHGDENTIIRKNPVKDHKMRKKLLMA
ncbi:ral guanine nucleotide dissociation stimulator-like isoform X2 [Penaeus chinensis]|uniref:ral guanine nucleotide dissociation stimulator-like isoform X2 n=1 Tax=Penaeus chinensis TaxID=139456 RepID=UPI001FB6E5A8|nr:ral guanine nucleotide dissociation stimulator-like isoform X2 [Penaeus chinensis]XP_047472835.1 ral guanine nucleotide dissociation stimulator-like isoform X2 [Penaeus chinensis]